MVSHDDVSVFVTVVEAGGFSASAKRLGLTRSAICRRVEKLEERLGARLLNRTNRHVTTTDAGQTYYERCKEIVQLQQEADLAVGDFVDEPRGTLRVNCAVMFGMVKVIPVLPMFLEKHSRMKMHLDLSDEPLDMSGNSFDLAIRFGDLPDSSLIVTRLTYTHQVICASPAYLNRYGRPQTPGDLRDHNCVLISGLGTKWNEWNFGGPGDPQVVRVSGNFVANSGDGNYEAIRAGIGIGRVLDIKSRADVAAGRLETVLDRFNPSMPRAICMIYQSRQRVPPKIRAFMDFLKHTVEGLVPADA
jgi:DNA-binding transcriptional LysR family regulator